MNQLLKQVTVFLLLYVCATTASAQDSRTTSSSSLLYQSVNKPAVIAEDHETLEKTIPSATIRRTKPTRVGAARKIKPCLLYTSPSPRDRTRSRMPSSA